jgi:endo-1,4-beta-xylanase
MKRREFIKTTSLAGAGVIASANELLTAPLLFTERRVKKNTLKGDILFKPYFTQKGRGPHLYDLVWATDENWDTFLTNINKTDKGIAISDSAGIDKFGINCRWNVEGFGFTNITADNGGEFYSLPPDGKSIDLNLNYELAKSRVVRNRSRIKHLMNDGWKPTKETIMYVDLSEGLFEDASKASDQHRRAELAQNSLKYALWGSEKMELDKADFIINRRGFRPEFFIGCDARGFYQMYQDIFIPKFTKLFNYANITFVIKGDGIIADFEPTEGDLQFEIRDVLFNRMLRENVTPEGRLLFWFHDCCIHDWLKSKSYSEILKYAEKHARDTVLHYGNDMYAWEIVNELHDWANELALSPDQTIELTRLINDTIKDAVPNVKRTINNCCPFAEYVQMNSYSGQPAKYRQRTPWQFTRDVIDAGIDIDIIEQQMYFPYRDLQDSILLIERFEVFGKPMHLSEVGVSGGPTEKSVLLGTVDFPDEPYLWHQPWDEESQADWLEQIYTLAYSKDYIQACNWFDFVDPFSYMQNGGLLRSPEGDTKEAYDRLDNLKTKWTNLKKT